MIRKVLLTLIASLLWAGQALTAVVGVTIPAGTSGSIGTTVDVTRSVTAGNILVAICAATAGSDFAISFSTFAGSTSAWTDIAQADAYNSTDAYAQEAAYATVLSTGSVTVRCTVGSTQDRFVAVAELSGVSGFDTAAYARSATATAGTANLSNTNAAATRIVFGAWWNGGTGGVSSGYTDGGTGWNFGGNFCRAQYLVESSVTARNGAFTAGGAAPLHITQFIFTDDTGGGPGGSALPKIIQQM